MENPWANDPVERGIQSIDRALTEEGLCRWERQAALYECLGWHLVSQFGTGKSFDEALEVATSVFHAIRDEKVDLDRTEAAIAALSRRPTDEPDCRSDVRALKRALLRHAAVGEVKIANVVALVAAELGVRDEEHANTRCPFYRRSRRAARWLAKAGLFRRLPRARFAITWYGRQVVRPVAEAPSTAIAAE
jgi:hypothetical protein